jgi:hypothetical protein
MDRADLRTILIGITAFTSILSLFGDWFPDLVPNFLSWIPFSFFQPLALLVFGGVGGWYLRGRIERTDMERVDSIEGCIKTGGTVWKATANVRNGEIQEINVPYEPRCPNCNSAMNSDKRKVGGTRGYKTGPAESQYFWICPNSECGYSTVKDSDGKDNALSLFQRSVEQILHSQNKPYSLDNLIEQIDGEVTGRLIWEQYDSVVNNEHVSTSCYA